ncbi:gamma-glutamyl-gamma-aminobutyrate hydrolase family protein [Prevotella pallens]|jgi:class I glutamine amidotransferase|uniref:gamma-glutamyl-gamma-aminobutyrate hydrolase family protein n=1 Tax=Prevotella pallens TaxID=60133 RepID=UPI001CB0C786|nr:gamma-glutamyl-gamma-aminobutyrate hydrolase family protein [Prevotella pallens]MBF1467550.1 membrane dipeptidase [Prevotella pallens]MBF1468604.1 membrane dipeptidase [Prevotella pallens]MBF1473137.1 membrane dipeptidase [Prevotella pallens]MBF1488316.1 membrane dipeptidase [Prevotella pallens]MBF1507572.1 membrane dipeptidase [Prevotella pallens]
MQNYDLDAHLAELYDHYPEGTSRPVIGIVTNFADQDVTIREVFHKQVIDAGGTPLLIPPTTDTQVIVNILNRIDGLLLTGGADVNPLWEGEEPIRNMGSINNKRDLSELLTTRLAYNRQIPIFAVCRGLQVLAIALGGKVQQHIYDPYIVEETEEKKLTRMKSVTTLRPAKLKHDQSASFNEPTHSIKIAPDSVLYSIYKQEKIFVNSFHHQAVSMPGKRFKVTAYAPDGVIECMESAEFKPIMGVQWHPEWLEEDGQKLFKWFVNEADSFRTAKQLHTRILTLDTHCDTPMFFPQGVDFAKRDPRILYDLHKMTEGHQDAVTMAAYLPQPRIGETFSSKIDVEGLKRFNPELTDVLNNLTPTSYADLIFNKIEKIVKDNNRYLSIARTPSDLYEDKRKGRKSIMFAIENGLALEGDLANVKYFAQRGVTYITLCHNGDNDICDSARGSNLHGGVSKFGAAVIREMNRNGIMVDLSHGAEKSFYDALEISSQPIVCSHSNSKALCNVPRNLTDDQLRALAKKGGVAHITLYHGFLRKEGTASVLDAIAHLEHAISIMGIDYVGIGTDFDGDGTVCGMADASEMINFTRHLLARKYSERDIEKIWGGNWLRVMAQVQAAKQK